MRSVLMVCYYFPPLGGIGSLRSLKLARYLKDYGWEATVLAPRAGTYHRDPSLLFPEERVIRTASLELSRVGKRALQLGRDTEVARVSGTTQWLRDWVRNVVYRPDPQVGWYPFAVRAGRQALRDRRFDAVFSSSFPITGHLVAMRLARLSGLPWLAEFRDLWTDLASYDSPARRRQDEELEHSILTVADEVITVSEEWSAVLARRGARAVSVVTNGYDPLDLVPSAPPPQPTITYVGTYYADRQDLSAALIALRRLLSSREVHSVKVRFVGAPSEPLRRLCERAGLTECVEWTGQVSYYDALRFTADSTALLLAGPAVGSHEPRPLRGHIPAKVFEYLGSGRPIFYVGSLDSDVARLLSAFTGVALVVPEDVEGAVRSWRQCLGYTQPIARAGLEPFTRQALAGRVARALDRISA